MEFAGVAQ